MRFNRFLLAGAATALTFATFTFIAQESIAQDDFSMGFFITSSGPGNGADLGGLAGADAHCQTLAAAVGSGDRTWRAYLSAQAKDDQVAATPSPRLLRQRRRCDLAPHLQGAPPPSGLPPSDSGGELDGPRSPVST